MSRIIASHAGDAPLRPRRVQFHVIDANDDSVVAVGRSATEMIDDTLGIFQPCRASFDKR
jgi:hypothetical protein